MTNDEIKAQAERYVIDAVNADPRSTTRAAVACAVAQREQNIRLVGTLLGIATVLEGELGFPRAAASLRSALYQITQVQAAPEKEE